MIVCALFRVTSIHVQDSSQHVTLLAAAVDQSILDATTWINQEPEHSDVRISFALSIVSFACLCNWIQE